MPCYVHPAPVPNIITNIASKSDVSTILNLRRAAACFRFPAALAILALCARDGFISQQGWSAFAAATVLCSSAAYRTCRRRSLSAPGSYTPAQAGNGCQHVSVCQGQRSFGSQPGGTVQQTIAVLGHLMLQYRQGFRLRFHGSVWCRLPWGQCPWCQWTVCAFIRGHQGSSLGAIRGH
jgi:hypothetical protein